MSSKRRDQRKAQKRTAREKDRKRARAAAQRRNTFSARLERAARWPLRECRISRHFRETHFAQVLVARESDEGIALAALLVDLTCLGVKESVVHLMEDEVHLRAATDRFEEVEPLEVCAPELAAKVVLAAERAASELGFRTPGSALAALAFLAGIDASACDEEFEHRFDGKPIYSVGPGDDVVSVMRRLEERVGEDGFHFVLPRYAVGDAPGVFGPSAEAYTPYLESDDPALRAFGRVRQAQESLLAKVARFTARRSGCDVFDDSAELHPAFANDEEVTDDPDFLYDCFLPWALFALVDDDDLSPGGALLKERGDALDPLERELCAELVRRPFSLHAVTATEPGRSISLRDLLTGAEHVVIEPLPVAAFDEGWIVHGRVVTVDGISAIVGLGRNLLPPFLQMSVIELRERIAGDSTFLDEETVAEVDALLQRTVERWNAELLGGGAAADGLHALDDEEPEQLSSTWCDDPLPSLQGKTPREAVATEAGRERVGALITSLAELLPGVRPDELRRELGLLR